MSEPTVEAAEAPAASSERVELDTGQADLGFGRGGVPWYLMVYYLAFLTFFVWYVLEYQLPDYLESTSEAGAVDEAPVEPR